MAMSSSRPYAWNMNRGRRATGNVKNTLARQYETPTGFVPPQAVYLFDPVTARHFTTQTGQIPGYAADPRYGRTRHTFRLNTTAITD